jgi:hypothetical protein
MVKIVGIVGITLLSFSMLFYVLILFSIQYQIEPPWRQRPQEKTFEEVLKGMD